MKAKIIFSLIPMIGCSIIVSIFIYQQGMKKDQTLERAILITNTVALQELQMVTMSEALRGYILDPKNAAELARKKEADKKYGEYSEVLAGLTKENKEIHDLNEEMAKLDADELDKKETQVAEMVNEDRVKVLEFFSQEYLPVRMKQNANFVRLKELATKYSGSIVEEINKKKIFESMLTIIFVLSGTFIGSVVIYFVNENVNKNASKVFDSIYSLSDQLTATARNLFEKSRELSDATTQEASAIQETASSLHEVTAMVQRNTDNANRSRELSIASRDASHLGLGSVQKMLTAMEDINQTQGDIIQRVDEGNKKIGDIVGVISAIGEKTKVINDIVFQTKLLSFNASVEAARAGEQGKGFAVVAEEVGNLAQMSGKAAQEITEMLDESIKQVSAIVEETKSNVEKIVYQGKDKISAGTNIANVCAASLEDVVKKIEEVDKRVEEIKVASNEQAIGISEINVAVGQLDQATQKNNTIATQTFESSKDLTEKSTDLRLMVDELVVIFKGKKADA